MSQPNQPEKRTRKSIRLPFLLIAFVLIFFSVSAVAGGYLGYQSAVQARGALSASQINQSLEDQYSLGLQDFAGGRFEVARQRFEYVLAQNPGYPGVAEQLAQVMAILYATSTPTPPAPTITPTPTRDLRPVQDLFAQAQSLIQNRQWSEAIDFLSSLRKEDPSFQTVRVDGLIYLALRYRGVEKILQQGNLQGGSYDLALAERFGPIDAEANSAREWARIYNFGLSFWEVHPEQAVYYFSQLAAAAPGLRDASGITAIERLKLALVQYGDYLARAGDWCQAQQQYQLALDQGGTGDLVATLAFAAEQCSPPTATITATGTFTSTLTATLTPTIFPGVTATTPVIPPTWTLTPTPPIPATTVAPTDTQVPPSEPPPASETPTLPPAPSDTPEPPQEPTPTDTLAAP